MKHQILPKAFLTRLCAGATLISASLLITHSAPVAYAQHRVVSAADPIGSDKNCSQIPAPGAAASAGYSNLAFCDDFNSEATIDVHGTGGPGYQWYPHTPGNDLSPDRFSVANSALTLEDSGVHNSWGLATWDYRTHNGRSFQFGYFEARIDFDPALRPTGDCGPGSCWPAFWAMSERHVSAHLSQKDPTPWTELDFFEAFKGDRGPHYAFFGGTAHVWKYDKSTGDLTDFRSKNNTQGTLVDWTKWHVVGCLWTKDRISWYLDGKKILEQSYPGGGYGDPPAIATRGKASVPKGVFQLLNSDPVFLILGSGPNWPMHIDWVRVWR